MLQNISSKNPDFENYAKFASSIRDSKKKKGIPGFQGIPGFGIPPGDRSATQVIILFTCWLSTFKAWCYIKIMVERQKGLLTIINT